MPRTNFEKRFTLFMTCTGSNWKKKTMEHHHQGPSTSKTHAAHLGNIYCSFFFGLSQTTLQKITKAHPQKNFWKVYKIILRK